MNKKDLHSPTGSLADENKKLKQQLTDVKKQYVDHINEEAQKAKVFSSFRLSHARREYLFKVGKGNLSVGLRKVIDDHMLCEGWDK